jgi:hypothetical protein
MEPIERTIDDTSAETLASGADYLRYLAAPGASRPVQELVFSAKSDGTVLARWDGRRLNVERDAWRRVTGERW